MRHYKNDVSHRVRRQPSVFSAGWFRLLLGVGLVVIVGLVVGPSLADWFWSGITPGAQPVASPPPLPSPLPSPAPTLPATASVGSAPPPDAPPATAIPATPDGSAPGTPAAPPAAESTGPAVTEPASTPPVPTPASGRPAATASAPTVPAQPGRPAGPESPAVYRVQVGAFLDHRNADRLVERLRGQKLEVVDRELEQSRLLYRVIALPAEGEGADRLVARVRELGFDPDLVEGGVAVAAPVPLHTAVETAKQLRAQGVATRLARRPGAAAFRVVRVGGFASAADAERLRGELAAQGLEGFVVRER